MLSSRRSIISISSNSSRILVRGFSQVPEKLEKKIVYQSKYGEKIKRLRKISLSSSIISTFMLVSKRFNLFPLSLSLFSLCFSLFSLFISISLYFSCQ